MKTNGGDAVSFTSEFAVKAAESDAEGLKSAQRVTKVQREHVFRHSTELHHNVVH